MSTRNDMTVVALALRSPFGKKRRSVRRGSSSLYVRNSNTMRLPSGLSASTYFVAFTGMNSNDVPRSSIVPPLM